MPSACRNPVYKYNNKPVRDANGRYFPSEKQANRFHELELLQRAGEIRNLRREVTIPIVVNGEKICSYRADATYDEKTSTGWMPIVEDVKSKPTAALDTYKIKKKLMKAIYGVLIREIF